MMLLRVCCCLTALLGVAAHAADRPRIVGIANIAVRVDNLDEARKFYSNVVGMAEAAMLSACMLGRSFAIVSFAKALEPWFAEIVAWHGLSSRCAAIRMLDEGFRSIDDVQDEKEAVLIDLALRTVTDDAADVVILAGAPLAGLANKIRDRVPVPLVDGIQAAVVMAEGLVRMRPRKATAGTYRRPAAKDSKGLSAALADVIGHDE